MIRTIYFLVLSTFTILASPPNIIVILVDDLGYSDLSSYGSPDIQTPHIDSLAKQGLKFTNFYANCPVCSPTRAALLSGKYPELVGVPGVIRTHSEDSWGYLQPSSQLLPSFLSKSNYHTALIGKWHLGLNPEAHPNKKGFQHFHGFLGDMMDDYYHHRRWNQNLMRLNRETITSKGHATDLFTDWTIQYLESQKSSPNPFFLYLAYNAPHTPIQPPQDWLEKIQQREPKISKKRAVLAALIEHMDHNIGRVISTLKNNKQWENTLVIFTSDNGGQLNVGATCGPHRGGKQDMYEGGLKVPTIATWPGIIKPNTSTDLVTISMDLFPTILEIANQSIPQKIDGLSILPFLKNEEQELPRRDLFFTRREGNLRYMGESSWAMRRGPWKLVKNSPMAPWELFNLTKDPLEKTDLKKTHPKEYRQLTQAMRAHIQRGGSIPWQSTDPK